jgi:hypothetical protein
LFARWNQSLTAMARSSSPFKPKTRISAEGRCVLLQASLPVRLNMIEPSNGQALSPKDNRLLAPKGSQARYTGEVLLRTRTRPKTAGAYTGEILLRTRPKTYYKVVQLLAEGRSAIGIARECRVSIHSVESVRTRRAADIEQRKKEIVGLLGDVATLGSERMVQTIGKAALRDAAIGTGIAVDKMLALTGQTPAVQVAILNVPSEAERAERRAIDARLDELTRRLMESCEPKP